MPKRFVNDFKGHVGGRYYKKAISHKYRTIISKLNGSITFEFISYNMV